MRRRRIKLIEVHLKLTIILRLILQSSVSSFFSTTISSTLFCSYFLSTTYPSPLHLIISTFSRLPSLILFPMSSFPTITFRQRRFANDQDMASLSPSLSLSLSLCLSLSCSFRSHLINLSIYLFIYISLR